ncbi:HlyD family type I secretion periplasmic adaptor subunit [Dyella nitratireducens]|uniref:Membrane fusion protein (MFP) family protein n=1 Tax=Dyella nitratireducens TaxID=1849580 RepID=A0ABQ1GQW2_9GAMM|nr:HlyD family type I secretion periplasmic adaptor subunit [Dyella nitratireducens]GGA48624.1 HlyD family type I secretion periplasmic adaptor subunit [Dyella nitratireducens]GLQ42287.1 HlyD family type I secretion periplasmic adaptor subunit [Dyella nitratireducens]
MSTSTLRWLAMRDLLGRYARVFQAAWGMRTALDVPLRLRHEIEFQPAALALRDAPIHPAPRWAMGLIVGLLALAVAWASLGKVDVVATAEGKIVPNGDVKTIQSEDTAVVTAIHATDGQVVKKGDVLIDLDATDAASNASDAEALLMAARHEAVRGRALLEAIDKGQSPVFSASFISNTSDLVTQRQVLAGEYADYLGTVREMEADIAQASASLKETAAEIAKLQGTLPIEETKEHDYAQLVQPGYVGRHDYYNEQQAVIQQKQDLAAQKAKLIETQATLDAARRKRDAYIAQTRRTWLEKIQDDETKATTAASDLAKARNHTRLMHLVAPVDGTVQQLSVHTVGGVVSPAQTLMTVVPAGHQLLVEATVDNQDIGFIQVGQPAEVKVEAFPYTRYGVLHGTVAQVSNDAKQDETDKRKWVFTAQIALPTDHIVIEGKSVHLTPGMAVTAEIKTGRRRIMSYLLSPLIQHAQESMHER